LYRRLDRIGPLYARYENRMPLPDTLDGAPEAAIRFYRTSRTNYAEMIIRATRYRLEVSRVYTAASGGGSDDQAWSLWRSSGMEVASDDIARNFLVAGDAYAIASQVDGVTRATAEDPRQCVTIHDPQDQSRRRAGAKFFRDEDMSMDYAWLYLPGKVFVAKRKSAGRLLLGSRFNGQTWDWDPDNGGGEGQTLPAGFEDDVCLVRYRNEEGVGEFERHEDILDRINHLILQGMVTITLQAFKQRAIKVDPADMPDQDPDTGEDIDYNEVFSADPGALWKLPQTAELWESGAVDVTPVANWVRKEEERLSAATFTPLHMFAPEGANQSAQGADLARDGFVSKAQDRQKRLGEGHAQTMSLLLRMDGQADRADLAGLRLGWLPAVRYGLAERADAAVKAKASDVPWRTRMLTVWQFTPEEVSRMESERMDDAILFPSVADAESAAAEEPQPTEPNAAEPTA